MVLPNPRRMSEPGTAETVARHAFLKREFETSESHLKNMPLAKLQLGGSPET